jgi:hypothetical protein
MQFLDWPTRRRERRLFLAQTHTFEHPKLCFAYFPVHIGKIWVWWEYYCKRYHASLSGAGGFWVYQTLRDHVDN